MEEWGGGGENSQVESKQGRIRENTLHIHVFMHTDLCLTSFQYWEQTKWRLRTVGRGCWVATWCRERCRHYRTD